MKTRIAFALLGLLIALDSFAQPHRLESYRHLLAEKEKVKGFKKDTGYINLLAKFSTCFYEINPDSLLFYSQLTYRYAKSIHHEKGEMESFCSMAYYYSLTGNYTQMLSFYQQALALAEELGMRPLIAHCHHGLGRLYGQTGRGAQARVALVTAIDLYRAMEMTFWLPQTAAALAEVQSYAERC